MKTNTCCFIGHRTICESEKLKTNLKNIIEKLILENNVDTFLFGSKSQFNSLCCRTVTELKEKYPHIKRVYVRAEYKYIDQEYENYLLNSYDSTYYPESVKASKAVYIKRNYEMIDNSSFCIIYYNEENRPTTRKSGTKIALDYAKRIKKQVFIID